MVNTMYLKSLLRATVFLSGMFVLGMIMTASGADWRTADRSSAGLAPDPADFSGAVIQVYAARTFSWRGALAVHTWIATKPAHADDYTVHHVLGFRSRRGLPVVVSQPDIPDRNWYGNKPVILVDIRGDKASALIPRVLDAVASYPYPEKYVMWPGPNSNTFTAHVGRMVPDLKLDLPSTAIGKDYLVNSSFFDVTPGGTGYQFSVFGLLGLSLALEEGVEFNLLGLNFGVNPLKLHLKLPMLGALGKPLEITPENAKVRLPALREEEAGQPDSLYTLSE
jgi:hypothetical protein